MAKVLQFRRGTTSGISTITGLEGELFVDLTKDTLVVMDGSTAGGQALQKEITASTNVNAGIVTTSSITSPFIMSYNQISSNFTVPSNYNAASVGPVLTINNGVVITVETNANWFILQPAS